LKFDSSINQKQIKMELQNLKISEKEIRNLSVKQIDELISQLEDGAHSLLWFQSDKKKFFDLRNIIGLLIDIRCEKMGIVL
jgi:hypothetical protein